ncbi:MAG: recombination-associated protein RdgC, partial [Candidatus Sedimenticola sp. 4PFRAG1]
HLLRETIGTLPLKPLEVAQSPASVMTAWLRGVDPAADFVVQDECELRDTVEEGGIIRCRRQDLEGEEIRVHLDAGKQVVRLAVEWHERLALVLTEDMSVKRLKFMDVIQEEAAEAETDDEAARFDVDFSLMSLELGRFIPRLVEIFGGLAEED